MATAWRIFDDIKNKNEKTDFPGPSVYQNTPFDRKGQENCQINVGSGLKGVKEEWVVWIVRVRIFCIEPKLLYLTISKKSKTEHDPEVQIWNWSSERHMGLWV